MKQSRLFATCGITESRKSENRAPCEEATNQAQREHALGMKVDKLSPYADDELYTRQLVFLDGWVRPLFKAAAIIYPGAKERLAVIGDCREACKKGLREAGKAQPEGSLGGGRASRQSRGSSEDSTKA